MNQKPAKADELFFVVDEHDQPLAPLPRKQVHGHGIWHRVAHLWIVNGDQILCQQRSLQKELNAGFWEAFIGGHLAPNETYEAAAVREANEELGIELNPQDLRLWKVYKFTDPRGYNNEFQAVFIANWEGSADDLRFKDGEVERVAWRPKLEVAHAIGKLGGKSWTNTGYELRLLEEVFHVAPQAN